MDERNDASGAGASLRERKRRETRRRVTDAGMCLFLEKGYDATTLDEIAAAAGISRRAFFHHFESKDEILLSMQSGMGDMIVAALDDEAANKRPLDAVRDAVMKVCAAIPTEDMIAIDRLMRTNAAVQARKQASYVQHEQTLFAALRRRWPAPERETGLRLVAMLSLGAVRLAFDTLSREGGRRPISDLLHEAFDALRAETSRP
jgi:AcrR family transcriptional regulator